MRTKILRVLSLLLIFSFFLPSNLKSDDYEVEKVKKNLPKMLGANNVGKKFWVTIPPCYEDESAGFDNFIKIFVTSPVETLVNVDIPGKGFHKQKKTIANDVIEFNITPTIGQCYTRVRGDPVVPEKVYKGFGIKIEAEQSIVVYIVVRYMYTSDGFLAIPTSSLGRQYIVASYGDMGAMAGSNFPSEAGIVGVYDKTQASFTLGGNAQTLTAGGLKPNQITSKVLNEGDVWMFSSDNYEGDLTGSKVSATKPVALVSGNFCTNIPTTNRWCDYTVEMDLPMYTWGKHYNVPMVPGRKYPSLVRIFAKEPNTQIFRDGKAIGNVKTSGGVLNIGYLEMRLVPFSSAPRSAVISGDKPIGVTLYNTGVEEDGTNVVSDPFVMAQTPIEQYQNEITFCTPAVYGGEGFPENYINLVYETNEFDMMPDDMEFATVSAGQYQWSKLKTTYSGADELFSYKANGKQYAVKLITLPKDGVYKIRGNKPFAAYSFGYSNYDSYGYPTSAALINVEKPDTNCPVPTWDITCDGTVEEGLVTDMPEPDSIRVNLSLIEFLADQSFNYLFKYDEFEAGTDRSTNWTLEVIDKSEDARAVIVFSDRNGNDTTLVIDYYASKITIRDDHDYGLLEIGNDDVYSFWAINESEDSPAVIDTIRLKSKDPSLTLEDQGFELLDLSLPMTIPPKDSVKFRCKFTSTKAGVFIDSIGIGDTCIFSYKVQVKARSGNAVIYVEDIDYGQRRVGFNYPDQFAVTNLTPNDVELEIWGYDDNTLSVYTHDLETYNISDNNRLKLKKGESKMIQVNFKPTEVKKYVDSIVFHSNAGTDIKNVAIIRGEGIKPEFEPNSYAWGRMRIDRPAFPVNPYPAVADGNQEKAIILRNGGSDEITIRSVEFEITGDPDAFIDENGNAIDNTSFNGQKIKKNDSLYIPVFFHPKSVGEHEMKITYTTDLGNDKYSVLKGTGVLPVLVTEPEIDFDTTIVGYSDVNTRTVTFRNLSMEDGYEWYDEVKIDEFVVGKDPQDIAPDNSQKSPNTGFSYNSSSFDPSVLIQPGEEIAFQAEFNAQKDPGVSATLTTKSDAREDVTSTWHGGGKTEALTAVGDASEICIGTEDTLTVTIENTGSAELMNIHPVFDKQVNGISMINYADDEYIEELWPGEKYEILILHDPNSVHDDIITLDFENVSKTQLKVDAQIAAKAVHYDRTSSITPVTQNLIVGDLATITVKLDEGPDSDISMAELQELEVVIKYDNDFLHAEESYLEIAGNLENDFTLDKIDGKDYVDQANGIVQFRIIAKPGNYFNEGTDLADLTFKMYFPSETKNEANLNMTVTKIGTMCVDVEESNALITIDPVCVDNIRHIAVIQGRYYLKEVAPNPVGSEGADVQYGIALKGMTMIGIYDEMGNLVDTPVSGEMKPGKYQFPLPMDKLSSGVYNIKMVSGQVTKTSKVVIVK